MKSSPPRTRNKFILSTAFVLTIIAFVRNTLTIHMFHTNETIRRNVEESELNYLASGDIFPKDDAMWNSSNQQAATAEVEVKDNSTLVVEVATSKVTNESFHSVQIASVGIISNPSTSLTLPPKTMGAFIHLGKTGGSSLAQSLQFGCHSFQLKACMKIHLKNNTKDDHIISKTTTYYHIPDIENGNLQMYDQKYPYQYFVITIRDPLSRAISSFRYNHPENRAVEGFNDLKRENGTRFIRMMRRVKNNQTEALEYIKERKHLGYVIPEERMLYRCFPNLEVYTKLLANFTDYTYVKLKDSDLNNIKSCAHLAKATLHHATPSHAMRHNHFDLRMILGPLKNVTKRPVLAIRTEFMKDDWLSSHKWLREEDVVFDSVAALRNSTMTEYPVKNDVSKGGRKNLCLALKDEYRIYMRILVLAKNLSKENVQDSVAIAQRNCPWLNLSLPDVHAPEKFVTETGIKWEF